MNINEILSNLLSGEKNKSKTEIELLKHFSRYVNHSDLKEGDTIIHYGNKGKLIKKIHGGSNKSIIGWEKTGRMNTYKEEEVYNIEFFKKPENYFS